MLHNGQNNKKIKHLHERCLRRTQDDKLSFYGELLKKDGLASIHHKNIWNLAPENFR